jgi:hypothetical protein
VQAAPTGGQTQSGEQTRPTTIQTLGNQNSGTAMANFPIGNSGAIVTVSDTISNGKNNVGVDVQIPIGNGTINLEFGGNSGGGNKAPSNPTSGGTGDRTGGQVPPGGIQFGGNPFTGAGTISGTIPIGNTGLGLTLGDTFGPGGNQFGVGVTLPGGLGTIGLNFGGGNGSPNIPISENPTPGSPGNPNFPSNPGYPTNPGIPVGGPDPSNPNPPIVIDPGPTPTGPSPIGTPEPTGPISDNPGLPTNPNDPIPGDPIGTGGGVTPPISGDPTGGTIDSPTYTPTPSAGDPGSPTGFDPTPGDPGYPTMPGDPGSPTDPGTLAGGVQYDDVLGSSPGATPGNGVDPGVQGDPSLIGGGSDTTPINGIDPGAQGDPSLIDAGSSTDGTPINGLDPSLQGDPSLIGADGTPMGSADPSGTTPLDSIPGTDGAISSGFDPNSAAMGADPSQATSDGLPGATSVDGSGPDSLTDFTNPLNADGTINPQFTGDPLQIAAATAGLDPSDLANFGPDGSTLAQSGGDMSPVALGSGDPSNIGNFDPGSPTTSDGLSNPTSPGSSEPGVIQSSGGEIASVAGVDTVPIFGADGSFLPNSGSSADPNGGFAPSTYYDDNGNAIPGLSSDGSFSPNSSDGSNYPNSSDITNFDGSPMSPSLSGEGAGWLPQTGDESNGNPDGRPTTDGAPSGDYAPTCGENGSYGSADGSQPSTDGTHFGDESATANQSGGAFADDYAPWIADGSSPTQGSFDPQDYVPSDPTSQSPDRNSGDGQTSNSDDLSGAFGSSLDGDNSGIDGHGHREMDLSETGMDPNRMDSPDLSTALTDEALRLEAEARKELEGQLQDENDRLLALMLSQEKERIDREEADARRTNSDAEAEQKHDADLETAAMLALLLAEEEKVRQDNKQELHAVQPGETLEQIALAKLKDPSLVPLIYQLNKSKIKVEHVQDKPVYTLTAGSVLTLPSRRQVREFKRQQAAIRLYAADPAAAESALAEASQRRANVEKYLGPLTQAVEETSRPRVSVRLGDSLRSIAMKHPAIQDVSLWRLLAQVNGLSTETDSKGTPTVQLRRGTTLVVPTADDIANYKMRLEGSKIPATPLRPYTPTASMTVITGNKGQQSFSMRAENLDVVEQKWVQDTIIDSLVEKLGDTCRIVKSTGSNKGAPSVRSQLEVLTGDTWVPILSYDICDSNSVRHEIGPDGTRRTIPIDLPAATVEEMMSTDIHSNWQTYQKKYLKQKTS